MKSMMGGMSAMRGMPAMPGGIAVMGGAGLTGGGTGGVLGAISRVSGMAGMGGMMGMGGMVGMTSAMQFLPGSNYSVRPDPQGGSSAGYLTLWNSPRVDTRIAEKATGKRAAVGFSGNRYFHPFAWDAIHLFELDYDDQGRVIHAWELGDPKAPRLDFTWDGQRLMKVVGRENASPFNVVYTRSLNYNGDKLTSENVSQSGGKSSKIEYKYDKQGRLVSAECDADHSLDGRSRKVHFVAEEN
jgi:YD repeat-containing protein